MLNNAETITRREAIEWLTQLHPGAVYFISNALSRDVHEVNDQPNHFYLVHGMGQALAVGAGYALANPGAEVVVISGDGGALMGMAAWSLLPLDNLTYYVLKNDVYQTTGGQPIGLTFSEPDDVLVVNIEQGGKIGRPKGVPVRDTEDVNGYLSPFRIRHRFEAWRDCRI